MPEITKLNPPGPPPYDPRADQRDEHPEMGLPPRTAWQQLVWNDWISKGRPADYEPPRPPPGA